MNKSEYVIRFSGLKDGLHQFSYEIGDSFFEQMLYSEIQKGLLHVKVDFEKKPNMLIVNFEVVGEVEVMCDKCTDNFYTPIDADDELIYQFGEGVSSSEKIIIIPENEIEIDLTQAIYEVTCIAVPSKRVHPQDECNQEMLNAMDNYLVVEEDEVESSEEEPEDEEVDPRWSALNKLKK